MFSESYTMGDFSSFTVSSKQYKNLSAIPDDGDICVKGYNTRTPGLIIYQNRYVRTYLCEGNRVLFENGESFGITSAVREDDLMYIYLDSPDILSFEEYGSLAKAAALSADGEALPEYYFKEYKSQYGLHGKLVNLLPFVTVDNATFILPLLCCFAMAAAVIFTAFLLYRRYSLLFALCFVFTFAASPWVVNFAGSVYWVEFTWLLPASFGLLLSLSGENRKMRLFSYGAIMLSVLIKCLCGYEYISFIMMGIIIPLCVDFVTAVTSKQKDKTIKSFITVIAAGISALTGFGAALLIHANIRGDGSVIGGLKSIYVEDILHRTVGTVGSDPLPDGVNALTVLKGYFSFNTSVTVGIEGSMFAALVFAPIVILVFNLLVRKKAALPDTALYITAFIGSVSWIVLATEHSFVHTHMNYVCWYYYLIPVCIYIILNQIKLFICKLICKKHNTLR